MTLEQVLGGPRVARTTASTAVTSDRRRRRIRAAVVSVGLLGLVTALVTAMLLVGSYGLAPWDVGLAILGLHPDPTVDFVVRGLRGPAVLTGLGVGLALGVAGTLFQQLLRNPLASPDIVGVSSGASLFAVGSVIVLGIGGLGVSGAALIGALLGCALVYALAWRDGIVGYRFILIGLGIAEFLASLTAYLLARADIYDAREALTWLVGSLGQAGSTELAVLIASVVILLPVAWLLGRPLRALALGDDTATALGTRVEPARFALIAVAILLVAAATAAAGPIAFVALIAGPIAARLLGPAGGGIIAAGLVGAAIVLAADLVAEHVLPVQLPTGVVTGIIGAPYLIWLLATANREGRGG